MAEDDENHVPCPAAQSGRKREFVFALGEQAALRRMGRTLSGKIRRFSLPEGDGDDSGGVHAEEPDLAVGEDVVEAVDGGESEELDKGYFSSPEQVSEGETGERSSAGALEVSVSVFSGEKEMCFDRAIVVDSHNELVEAPPPIDFRNANDWDEVQVAIVTDGQNGLVNGGRTELVETVIPIDCRFDTEVVNFGDDQNRSDVHAAVVSPNNVAGDVEGCDSADLEDVEKPKMESATAVYCKDELNLDTRNPNTVNGKSKLTAETASDMDCKSELKQKSKVTFSGQDQPNASNAVGVDGRAKLKREKISNTGGLYQHATPKSSERRFTRSLLKSLESAIEVSPPSPGKNCCLAENANAFEDQNEAKAYDRTMLEDAVINLNRPCRRFTRSLLKSMDEIKAVTSTGSITEESDAFEQLKDLKADMRNATRRSVGTTPNKKMELKMSKKIALTNVPTKIKDLLATGLLDGLPVKYVISGEKEGALSGVIKDGCILCFCSSCNGRKTVSAYQFDMHAGGKGKHPANFTYLENGRSLRHIIKACRTTSLDSLESTIKNAVASHTKSQFSNCQQCKAPFLLLGTANSTLICDACLVDKPATNNENTSSIGANKTRPATNNDDTSSIAANKTCSENNMLLQKTSVQRRMTTKDFWLHKLVFLNNTLPDGTEVAYYTRGQRLLEGYIKGSGIFCRCCNSVVSPSQFEAHAGCAQRKKPYLNIYTSNGVSLHELSVSLSKDRSFSTRENDDLCRICAGDGDLLLCDSCPRSFHKECVGLSTIPEGSWYCPCCKTMIKREKYVEHNDNAIAAGRVSGVDPIDQILKRCIRIVQNPEMESSSCVLCSCHDFSKSGFGPRTVLLCDQCEKEFHIGCLKSHHIADLDELPEGEWFCCSECGIIYIELQKFVLSGEKQLPELALDIIKTKGKEKGLINDLDPNIRWQLLKGKMASADSRLLLAGAVAILQESFDPIIDLPTGQDLIPFMVYGKDIGHQDYGGVYCAILTVNSSVVSVGLLRVLGQDAAELPLVATAKEGQGLGYFQALFSCIEALLESLQVKHLVLPATKEAENIWVQKFGFGEISQSQLEEYTRGSRPISFQSTPMLHKLVPQSNALSSRKSERGG